MSIEAMKQALVALEGYKKHTAGVMIPQTRCQGDKAITTLRQAIEQAEKPWVKTYCGGKPNYTTPVDGIDISQERVDETVKHEHEFFCPRCGHCCRDGLERLIRIMGTFDLVTGHADTMDEALDALESELQDVLGHLRARREWVGLTEDEKQFFKAMGFSGIDIVEAKLKEKNT